MGTKMPKKKRGGADKATDEKGQIGGKKKLGLDGRGRVRRTGLASGGGGTKTKFPG